MIPNRKPICDYRALTCRMCGCTFTSPAGNATVCPNPPCRDIAKQQAAERMRQYQKRLWAKKRTPQSGSICPSATAAEKATAPQSISSAS